MKNYFFLFVFLLAALPLSAQWKFKQDRVGNPVMTQAYVDEVIMKASWEGLDGQTYSMANFEGKLVVIDFWQTWCKPCLVNFQGFDEVKKKYGESLEIIAAAQYWNDTEERIKDFIARQSYDFTYVWAPEMGEELGITAIPYKIIIGPDGRLLESRSGSGSLEEEYQHLSSLVSRYARRKKK
jgi:thiol-disulfide isomerase/thioredoxin